MIMLNMWACRILHSSVNKHGTKHFLETGHPVIKSYEPGEDWRWCYVDDIFWNDCRREYIFHSCDHSPGLIDRFADLSVFGDAF